VQEKRPLRIHFMGIGGSGMSAVAQIAHARGYIVTGCDLQTDTPYIEKVKKLGITVSMGHNSGHLKDIDILAVTPAVFYQNDDHPETALGREKSILMKWQEFMGKYLHKNKFVICIAGTHGKSTTTALAGILLETAGLDPTVEVGATVLVWHNNFRLGKSDYFISEADEFHENFASYRPDIIILNNIEMDHPEFFTSEENLLDTYQNFINSLKPGGHIIVNRDSPLITQLRLPPATHYYSLKDTNNIEPTPDSTSFEYHRHKYSLKIPGRHNISNALGIIKLAEILNINHSDLNSTLKQFSGIGRRLELIGEKNGVKIYDDYANHPTAFAATINGVKQLHPQDQVIAVIEPHTFTRLRTLLPQLPESLRAADKVIISKIFASRETDPGDFSGADITAASKHDNCRYIPEFNDIILYLRSLSEARISLSNTVILVMGSGLSHKLSRQIFESL